MSALRVQIESEASVALQQQKYVALLPLALTITLTRTPALTLTPTLALCLTLALTRYVALLGGRLGEDSLISLSETDEDSKVSMSTVIVLEP